MQCWKILQQLFNALLFSQQQSASVRTQKFVTIEILHSLVVSLVKKLQNFTTLQLSTFTIEFKSTPSFKLRKSREQFSTYVRLSYYIQIDKKICELTQIDKMQHSRFDQIKVNSKVKLLF
eukprot:TRINITY_DN1217_c0_g1_i12.p7 TRINITY_DN1217_c0_g1~~TRINITY_DN1217_c0_g1_i12.p7  ORF type:complete len:120 (+),score=0.77 TRINITY_DN1217_c0_g1_i12:1136-1495(+)